MLPIDRVREAATLPEVVGGYVRLRSRGKDFLGLCPFHKERTPSLVVHPEYWHCFGCGAGGDVFAFIQRIEGVQFAAALRSLASRYGISEHVEVNPHVQARARRLQLEAEFFWGRMRRFCGQQFVACRSTRNRAEAYVAAHLEEESLAAEAAWLWIAQGDALSDEWAWMTDAMSQVRPRALLEAYMAMPTVVRDRNRALMGGERAMADGLVLLAMRGRVG